MKIKNLAFTILSLISINVAADRISRGGGAADPGGGETLKSSMAQVEMAFEKSRQSFIKLDGDSNSNSNILVDLSYYLQEFGNREDGLFLNDVVFKAMFDTKKLDLLNQKLKDLNEEFRQMDRTNHEATMEVINKITNVIKELDDLREQGMPENYFAKNKFIIEKEGSCFDMNGEEKDASVTKHSFDGKICISFKNLMKVAPYNLEKEINGLIIHEITHLAGYDEEVAQRVQNMYLEVADNLFQHGSNGYRMLKLNIQDQLILSVSDLYYSAKSLEFEAQHLDIRPTVWKYKELVKVGKSLGVIDSLIYRLLYLDASKEIFDMDKGEIELRTEKLSASIWNINSVINMSSSDEKQYLEAVAKVIKEELQIIIPIVKDFGINTDFYFRNFEL